MSYTKYLGDGVIYLPPKCPDCRRTEPNEIQDGGKRPLYQCVGCGRLWERQEWKASNMRLTWGIEHEFVEQRIPIERKRLPEP
jgi:hypothetical protein